jgi:signal transduction histidine kinase
MNALTDSRPSKPCVPEGGRATSPFYGKPLPLVYHIIISSLLFVVGTSLGYRISFLQHKADISRIRDRTALEIDQIRNNLSRELYASINLTQGLVDLVRISGEMKQSQFDALARELIGHNKLIRNVALAPDNVIRFIYPLYGNEKALGLDYLKTPDQAGAILRAIEEKHMVIAGPLRLVQGGVGIIGRTPIFIRDSASKGMNERYWGIASTVIDFDTLVHATGMRAIEAHLHIALRGTDGTGSRGKVFWGDTGVFASAPVIMDIALPSGAWQMAVVPSQGWPRFNPWTSAMFLGNMLLSIFFSTMFFQILRISQSRAREIQRRKATEAALLQKNKERDEAIAALKRARDELERRVIERTEQLLRAKEAAESADRLKSAFLATMSHELRTPLNSIIGFTGIILQGLVGELSEEQKKQLSMVRDSAHHLLALINDVLDISKIEAGQLELRLEEFPLLEAIEKSIEIVRPMAEKKSLPIICTTDSRSIMLPSDRRRVEQILINLLNNAVKFTTTGEITVVIRKCQAHALKGEEDRSVRDDTAIRIAVRDTGIGIKSEDLKMLFQPFHQLDTGMTRRYDGTGLGLSICKKLSQMLGGNIDVCSDGTGKGSTFTLTLPLGRSGNG